MLPTHREYAPRTGDGFAYTADKTHRRSLWATLRIWSRRNPALARVVSVVAVIALALFLYFNVGRPSPTPTIPVAIHSETQPVAGHDATTSRKPGSAETLTRLGVPSAALKDQVKAAVEEGRHSKVPESVVQAQSAPIAQTNATSGASDTVDIWKVRRERVKGAFLHAWDGYRKYAWGYDELEPLSQRGRDWFGMGLTIIDALDTSLIMDLKEEYKVARDWVASRMTLEKDVNANVFEVTIRVLGGLLSAYHLSGSNDTALLNRAVEVGDLLMLAFNTASKIPLASVNPALKRAAASHDGGDSSTAEVTTVQLEFRYLSYLTGETKYWKAVEDVMVAVGGLEKYDGLVPIFINPISGQFSGKEIRLGSRGDSYYEYLLKQWLQTNRTEQSYLTDFDTALGGISKHLVAHSKPSDLIFVGELPSGRDSHSIHPKMDHLVCYLPGTLALRVSPSGRKVTRFSLSKTEIDTLEFAESLAHTCYETYRRMASGLAPEITYFRTNEDATEDLDVRGLDAHNLLRPETVESFFVLWRVTGDGRYRQWGWNIFEAFEKWTKVEGGGFSALSDVRKTPPPRRDRMDSFFLGETLKYLFLLFSDDSVIPLDQFVFNTEAHPLPVFAIDGDFAQKLGSVSSSS
ncbi:glycoside hydrolase family 47 protein [Gonapodya prolifera JEL478]|uniref:alpha-1,2-Mannosidase n=1 Tax=Gonapodya prolifera (strain JEL478) TaxID=1344416 RepID=A0A139AHR1_GONPJ|nr:glycoside hydrolase family 47 protein [Gonapodya prolifera JEL478]|eukprot:KXS16300.1 glycoside hydrolase family 47 protein [Gonapodya prolifera JEL478]